MGSEKEQEAFPLLAAKPSGPSDNIFLCKNYSCLAPFLSTKSLFLEIEKSNILVVGQTGTGKTLVAKTIAKMVYA
jgi:ATP-dependent protease Clp ATPase subunit